MAGFGGIGGKISGIFSKPKAEETAEILAAESARSVMDTHFPFISQEFENRRMAAEELDRQESLQLARPVISDTSVTSKGAVLMSSRNLPKPEETKRHPNQDLLKVIEINPDIKMCLLIDGASVGVDLNTQGLIPSHSEEMVAAYAKFLEENLFPNFKSDLPEILKLLTGLPSDALTAIESLENLMKNVHSAFIEWVQKNAGQPGFENYDKWFGIGYMSLVFPIKRISSNGTVSQNAIIVEMGSKDYQYVKEVEEGGVKRREKKVKYGDSGHVVIVNGENAESGVAVSSYFNHDSLMGETSGEYNNLQFPDETLSGYNVWFGAKPNSPNNVLHTVRPDDQLRSFRLTVVKGLKPDAVIINTSDAVYLDTVNPEDARRYKVKNTDDASVLAIGF